MNSAQQIAAKDPLGFLLIKRTLTVTLALYSVAVLTTMAGMEIFGWLSAALSLVAVLFFRKNIAFAKPVLESFDWVFIALAATIVLSAVFAVPENADRVFIAGNGRFVFLFLLLRLGLEIVGTAKIEKMIPWIVAITCLIGVYAIYQNITGIDLIRGHRNPIQQETLGGVATYRSRGMWDHPVRFGHSIALTLCVPIAFFIARYFDFSQLRRASTAWRPVLFVAAILTAGAGLFYSHTRGAWIGMVAAILGMSFYAGRALFVRSLAIFAIAGTLALTVSPELRGRFQSLFQPKSDGSSMARIDIWRANFEMFLDRPIIGVGYGVNEDLIGEYYAKLGITQTDGGHAHNNFIQMLSGTGVIGFSLYLAFAILMLVWTHRLIRTAQSAQNRFLTAVGLMALGAQLVIHIGGLTECSFKSAQINHQYLFILAILVASSRQMQGFRRGQLWN